MILSFGLAFDWPASMLGDYVPVALNTLFPSNILKKKHYAVAYHQVREVIVTMK
jgi:hypothetical protein